MQLGIDNTEASAAQAGDLEREWVQVATVGGGAQAAMTVEFLQAHGIQAWSWQEGVGDALGLTVGVLGSAHILVPESDAELAISLLETPAVEPGELEAEGEEEPSAATSETARAILAAAAFVLSPVATGLTLLLAPLLRSKDKVDALFLMTCPGCGVDLELTEDEVARGWCVCSECNGTYPVD